MQEQPRRRPTDPPVGDADVRDRASRLGQQVPQPRRLQQAARPGRDRIGAAVEIGMLHRRQRRAVDDRHRHARRLQPARQRPADRPGADHAHVDLAQVAPRRPRGRSHVAAAISHERRRGVRAARRAAGAWHGVTWDRRHSCLFPVHTIASALMPLPTRTARRTGRRGAAARHGIAHPRRPANHRPARQGRPRRRVCPGRGKPGRHGRVARPRHGS